MNNNIDMSKLLQLLSKMDKKELEAGIAKANIVILGVLRGLAHAGAKGNKKAIIATHRIECPQLRIANILKEMENEELEETKQFASVKEDHIILE